MSDTIEIEKIETDEATESPAQPEASETIAYDETVAKTGIDPQSAQYTQPWATLEVETVGEDSDSGDESDDADDEDASDGEDSDESDDSESTAPVVE